MTLSEDRTLTRRTFVRNGALFLMSGAGAAAAPAAVRFGIFADTHHAVKPPARDRYYRDSMAKLRDAVAYFKRERMNFVVELGDFIDEAPTVDAEAEYLRDVDAVVQNFNGDRHHVLGNHCVWTLNKPEFLGITKQERSYYSFDRGGLHFIVLDACFTAAGVPYGRKNFDWKDAEIPEAERKWLAHDLAASNTKTIVFVHQRLDVGPPYGIASGAAVRKILEQSGKVAAVFQGHHHRNEHNEIGGIHYCTLEAMIEGPATENNAYCCVSADRAGNLQVEGFSNQSSYNWRTAG
jgi:alkaline phosphatase